MDKFNLGRRTFLNNSFGAGLVIPVAYPVLKSLQDNANQKSVERNSNSEANPKADSETRRRMSRISVGASLVGAAPYAAFGGVLTDSADMRSDIRDKIKEEYPNDPGRGCLDWVEARNRRDFLTGVTRAATTAAMTGPLLAELFGKNLKAYLTERQDDSDKPLKPEQVIDAIEERNDDYVNNSFFYGGLAGAVRTYYGNRNQKWNNASYKQLISLFTESRESLRKESKANIPGFNSILSGYKPPLVDFLPPDKLLDIKTPLYVTLTIGKEQGQAAYFPDNGGDDTNWSGPGIYPRDIQGKRKISETELYMPDKSFSLEIN